MKEHSGHSRIQREGRTDHGDNHRDGGVADLWCVFTILRGADDPATPESPASQEWFLSTKESLGWLNGTWISHLTLIILFVGFGHSVLAMSGEETLAQVNREIEHPKLKNLEKTGPGNFHLQPAVYFAGLFFAVMMIPDKVRPEYFANLIGGIAMYLGGSNLGQDWRFTASWYWWGC